MTDRPILFSAPMIRALLDGRKTQTRRVINPQPTRHMPGMWRWSGKLPYGDSLLIQADADSMAHELKVHTVRYCVGDRLYVREAWHAARSLDSAPPRDIPHDADIEHAATARSYAEIGLKGKLRPSMFMPRWASRLTLIVTDVRVERLQEITWQDAKAEGISGGYHQSEFASLWDSLNAKPRPRYGDDGKVTHYESFPWGGESGTETYRGKPHHIHANPWVVALTFEVIRQNIDQIEGGAL